MLALKLLLAHFTGDFLLQPTKWVQHKFAHKHRSVYLYLHVGIQSLLLWLLLGFQFRYLSLVAIYTLAHFLTDLAKLLLHSASRARRLFWLDQAAHLIALGVLAYVWEPLPLLRALPGTPKLLAIALSMVLLTSVGSMAVRVLLGPWGAEIESSGHALPSAGKYIGMLERVLIFVFITAGQWSGVGFLIAAKSVFRFGDLSHAGDRKLTEYILIGTLLSVGWAVVVALGYGAFAKWG
jgi:hypothetical protein